MLIDLHLRRSLLARVSRAASATCARGGLAGSFRHWGLGGSSGIAQRSHALDEDVPGVNSPPRPVANIHFLFSASPPSWLLLLLLEDGSMA